MVAVKLSDNLQQLVFYIAVRNSLENNSWTIKQPGQPLKIAF